MAGVRAKEDERRACNRCWPPTSASAGESSVRLLSKAGAAVGQRPRSAVWPALRASTRAQLLQDRRLSVRVPCMQA